MNLPNRLFFTGCPGSKWSGIAQDLEKLQGVNTSDHSPNREYKHGEFSGHKGAYFGTGMEFSSDLALVPPESLESYLDAPWASKEGMKIVKSHNWAYQLPSIRKLCPNDWIMLIYRPANPSYSWWIQAGGFDITYPSYAAYKDYDEILNEIVNQNKAMMSFGFDNKVVWHHYTKEWVEDNFGQTIPKVSQCSDVLVTLVK